MATMVPEEVDSEVLSMQELVPAQVIKNDQEDREWEDTGQCPGMLLCF